ncbi:hypothetical protein P389DRAFT_144816, partial [Cystobasidium minutum MCA 4210]|uniref:uncharacterized protein n=1 Tax=Cystobasidium minutum MCA 4210 TaxID=1397322 RepID=UPI0034CD7C26
EFCIVGNASVGKSSILVQLTDKRFLGASSEPTIGVEFGSRLIPLEDGRKIKLQIWDTAGQETFRAVTRSYYRGAEGCLLVFDVNDRRSFTDLHIWLDDLKQWAEEDVVIMVVGNKSKSFFFHPDFHSPLDTPETREVTRQEGEEWAEEHGLMYLETSAKTGEGIEEAFENTARKIHEHLSKNREQLLAKRKKRQGAMGSFPSLTGGSNARSGCC